MKLELSYSYHAMPCIQLENASDVEREFLRMAVLDNFTDSPFYQRKQKVSPFLQTDYDGYLLIEFWGAASIPEIVVKAGLVYQDGEKIAKVYYNGQVGDLCGFEIL